MDVKTYDEYQRECLYEDARNFVANYIAYQRDCDAEDIPGEDLDGYDYDYLVAEFEKRQDCNVPFNGTWEYVVEKYMEDFEDEAQDENSVEDN